MQGQGQPGAADRCLYGLDGGDHRRGMRGGNRNVEWESGRGSAAFAGIFDGNVSGADPGHIGRLDRGTYLFRADVFGGPGRPAPAYHGIWRKGAAR